MAAKSKKYTDYTKTETKKVEKPKVSTDEITVEAEVTYVPDEFVVTCELLNFRSTPKIEDNVMVVLHKGDVLVHNSLTMNDAPRDWIFVEFENNGVKVAGYVMRKFLKHV